MIQIVRTLVGFLLACVAALAQAQAGTTAENLEAFPLTEFEQFVIAQYCEPGILVAHRTGFLRAYDLRIAVSREIRCVPKEAQFLLEIKCSLHPKLECQAKETRELPYQFRIDMIMRAAGKNPG